MKKKYRKPLTAVGLRNCEKLCAIVQNATKETLDTKRVGDAIVSLAWGYAPRLLADLRRARQHQCRLPLAETEAQPRPSDHPSPVSAPRQRRTRTMTDGLEAPNG